MELNIPEANENEMPETDWIDVKSIAVGSTVRLNVDRVHLGEKAICFFDDSKNEAVSLFHVSDYEGETLGERSLIALGQALGITGKKISVDDLIAKANEATLSMSINNSAFDTEDGEGRTYKRIRFKTTSNDEEA